MGALDGRTAIVTGAGRGIGAAISMALDAAGAQVALDRPQQRPSSTTPQRRSSTTRSSIVADLSHAGRTCSSAAAAALGCARRRVDVLVNNAGDRACASDIELLTVDETRLRCWNVERPRRRCCSTAAVIPAMVAQAQSGAIVSISSLSGRAGHAAPSALRGDARQRIDGMTRSLAMEYGPARDPGERRRTRRRRDGDVERAPRQARRRRRRARRHPDPPRLTDATTRSPPSWCSSPPTRRARSPARSSRPTAASTPRSTSGRQCDRCDLQFASAIAPLRRSPPPVRVHPHRSLRSLRVGRSGLRPSRLVKPLSDVNPWVRGRSGETRPCAMKLGLFHINMAPEVIAPGTSTPPQRRRTRRRLGSTRCGLASTYVLPDPQVPPLADGAGGACGSTRWLALGWAAANTTTIKLATGIVILPQRNPVAPGETARQPRRAEQRPS
ncbi:MAG: SDR family NAD(P)-dependent oxidoreductase [Ilumatobacteraceae bacterium]